MRARSRRSRRPKWTRYSRSLRAPPPRNRRRRPPNSRPQRAHMSQAEDPERIARKQSAQEVSVEDVRQLMGASTPHFALQLRNRIAALIADLPADHPARLEGEREIARLERLGLQGETRGEGLVEGERPLPSLELPAAEGHT